MKRFLPSLMLGACLSTPAYAELTRISISGIVTSASISSGEFSGMRVGDTWTFEMLIERTPQLALSNVADLSFSDSFHLTVDQTIGGGDFISASFSTREGSFSITEHDLVSHNGVSSFFPFGEPTPEIQAQIAANTRFDLFVSAIDPTTLDGLSITELLNFYGPELQFFQGTDASDIRYLDELLPQDLFGATAAGERWASIGLDGAAIDSLITNYYIASVSGRSVPSPAGLAVLGVVGFAGARRQR